MNPFSTSTALPTTITIATITTAATSSASTTDTGGDTLQLHILRAPSPIPFTTSNQTADSAPSGSRRRRSSHRSNFRDSHCVDGKLSSPILQGPSFSTTQNQKTFSRDSVNVDSNISDPATNSMALATLPDPSKSTAAAKNVKNKLIVSQSRPQTTVPRAVVRSLSCDGEIEIALRHLRMADPHLARLIDLHQPPTFDSFQTPFLALSKSILYQQLAYKAGTSIYARLVTLCGGEVGVVPETVLALTLQQHRQIGVSSRKASYLHDLARKYQRGILSDSAIV